MANPSRKYPSHVTLVLIALCLTFAAVFSSKYNEYQEKTALLAAINDQGGSVVMRSGRPTWLRNLLPRPWRPLLDTPKHVQLPNTTVDNTWLAQLTACRELEMLNLSDTEVTDAGMEHLREFHRLKVFWLSGSKVGDAGIQKIHVLKNLTLIYLDDTQVTEDGILKPRAAIPGVDVQR